MTAASLRKASDAHRTAPARTAASTSPALALYEQIKAFITHKIQDGSWGAGHRLPSESELVAQFGVARMTVNRALRWASVALRRLAAVIRSFSGLGINARRRPSIRRGSLR